MTHVELVIGVVGFILENSPFPSSWFFPEKNSFRKRYEKMQLMYSAILVHKQWVEVEVVTEDSYTLIISIEIKFF